MLSSFLLFLKKLKIKKKDEQNHDDHQILKAENFSTYSTLDLAGNNESDLAKLQILEFKESREKEIVLYEDGKYVTNEYQKILESMFSEMKTDTKSIQKIVGINNKKLWWEFQTEIQTQMQEHIITGVEEQNPVNFENTELGKKYLNFFEGYYSKFRNQAWSSFQVLSF